MPALILPGPMQRCIGRRSFLGGGGGGCLVDDRGRGHGGAGGPRGEPSRFSAMQLVGGFVDSAESG